MFIFPPVNKGGVFINNLTNVQLAELDNLNILCRNFLNKHISSNKTILHETPQLVPTRPQPQNYVCDIQLKSNTFF